MTNLIERVTVTVTLNHDKINSAVYSGDVDLWEDLEKLWPIVPSAIWFRDGNVTVRDGALKIEWKSSGLYEEVESGDN